MSVPVNNTFPPLAGAFAQAGAPVGSNATPKMDDASRSLLVDYFKAYHINDRLEGAADTAIRVLGDFKKLSRAIEKARTAFAIQEILLEKLQVRDCDSRVQVLNAFYPTDRPAFLENFKHLFEQTTTSDTEGLASACRSKLSYFLNPYQTALDLYRSLRDLANPLKEESTLADLYAFLGDYFRNNPEKLEDYLTLYVDFSTLSQSSNEEYGRSICHAIAYKKPFDTEQFHGALLKGILIREQSFLQAMVTAIQSSSEDIQIKTQRYFRLIQAVGEKLAAQPLPISNLKEKVCLTLPHLAFKPAVVLNSESFQLLKFLPPYVDAVLKDVKCSLPLGWFYAKPKYLNKFVQLDLSFSSEPSSKDFGKLLEALPNLTKLNLTGTLKEEHLDAIAKKVNLISLSLQGCTLPTADGALLPLVALKKVKRIDLSKTEVTAAQLHALITKIGHPDLHLQHCKNLTREEIVTLQNSTTSFLFSNLV